MLMCCMVCIDYVKGTLTSWEAKINLQELKGTLTEEHYEETLKLIVTDNPDDFDSSGTDRMD